MKRLAIGVVVVVAIVVIALFVMRGRGGETGSGAGTSSGSGMGSDMGTRVSTGAKPPEHVKQIGKEERAKLAERIAAGQAERASHHSATPRPSLPESHELDLEHVSSDVMTAMKEAIPFLAACYKEHGKPGVLTASAFMTLTGDPDIGTIIDADQIFDEQHQPLDTKLDECLRNTMQTLALPPLKEGNSVKIQYSFQFSDDDETGSSH